MAGEEGVAREEVVPSLNEYQSLIISVLGLLLHMHKIIFEQ